MPDFKKFISVLCAAAILATSAVVPVMAAPTEVVSVDYAAGAENDWTLASDLTTASSADGLTITNGSNRVTRTATKTLDTAIEESVLIEYEVKNYCRGDNDTVFTIGADESNPIITYKFKKSGSSSELNGVTLPSMAGSSYYTPMITVSHIVNMGMQEVTSTVKDGDTLIYEGVTPFAKADVTSVQYFGIALGKYNATTIKNLKISTLAVPVITETGVEQVEVGLGEAVAIVENAEDVTVELSNDTDFAAEYIDGEVKVKALDGASSGASTNVIITAVGDVTVTKTVNVTALTAQDLANAVADALDITEGNPTISESNGEFIVASDFTLPVSSGVAQISWASDDEAISVADDGTVTVDTSVAKKVTLKATVSYNGVDVEKTFVIRISNTITYYNEDFESVPSKVLANLTAGKYTDYEGFVFGCGERSDGGLNEINVTAGTNPSSYSGKGITLSATKYNDDGSRSPYINLTETDGAVIANQLYVSLDIYFGNDATGVVLNDGTNSVTLNTAYSDKITAGNWYNFAIVSDIEASEYEVIISDKDGKYVDSKIVSGALTNLVKIGTKGASDISASIDNLKVMDTVLPSIALNTVSQLEVGQSAVVATVSDADSVEVSLTNDAGFLAEYVDGEVIVKALSGAVSGAQTYVSVKALNGDGIGISKGVTVTALTIEDMVNRAVDAIDITDGNFHVVKDGDVYKVTGTFNLPVESGAVSLVWTSDDEAVSVSEDGTVTVDASQTKNLTLTLTASYNGFEVTKEFPVRISTDVIYYDEDFEDFATGSLVNLGASSNTKYDGFTFACGGRSDGGGDAVNINVNTNSPSGKGITLSATNYNADGSRSPYITLLNTEGITVKNKLYIEFDVNLGNDTVALNLTDGVDTITLNTAYSDAITAGNWYNFKLISDVKNEKYDVIISDTDGNVIDKMTKYTVFKGLTQIKTSGAQSINVSLDNLKVLDSVIPDIEVKDVVEIIAGKEETIATVTGVNSDRDINVTLSDNTNFSVTVANGEIKLKANENATIGAATDVDIKATYGSVTIKEALAVTALNVDAVVNAVKAVPVVLKYASDAKGKFDVAIVNGAVIVNDVIFPTSLTVNVLGADVAVDEKWTVSGDAMDENGKISVSDKEESDITLTRTLSYKGVSYTETYDVAVQFDAEEVEMLINADTDITAEEKASYLEKAVYEYQVRFDAELEDNFEAIPSSKNSGSFELPAEGLFGSTITWDSSNPSVISVKKASGVYKATVKPATSDKTVKLTGTITAGTVTGEKYIAEVSVDGKSSGSSGGGGGGSTRPSGNSGTINSGNIDPVTIPDSNVEFNPNPSGFDDLDTVPWAVTAINNLYVNGIINGKTPALFYPNDNVTRAEFAKMIIKAFDIALVSVEKSSFYDVNASSWESVYVETAFANGIITGYEDGSFEPNTNVTRQDMAVMVKRAADVKNVVLTGDVATVTFTDDGIIAAYAKEAVSALQKAGIVSGVADGSFAPLSSSTRAQACQILYNVFNR